MAGRFDGKVVWITGASSGIGRDMAREFAREGAKLVVSARRQDRLQELQDELAKEFDAECHLAPCDVTDEAQVKAAVAAAVERFGGLDVAVANAGFGVAGRIERLEVADWRRQLDVNVIGAVATIRYALPEIKKTRGRMALVASVAGHIASPRSGAYNASKYALRAIGQVLSMEMAMSGTGVTCTTLCPGYVDSEIHQIDNSGVLHEGRSQKPNKLSWTSQKAARVMVRAIHARKREYVFTAHGVVGAWLGRHFPGLTHFAQTRSSGGRR
jgi:short-subunit dehydrogenase